MLKLAKRPGELGGEVKQRCELDRLERRGPVRILFPVRSVGTATVVTAGRSATAEHREARGCMELSTYQTLSIRLGPGVGGAAVDLGFLDHAPPRAITEIVGGSDVYIDDEGLRAIGRLHGLETLSVSVRGAATASVAAVVAAPSTSVKLAGMTSAQLAALSRPGTLRRAWFSGDLTAHDALRLAQALCPPVRQLVVKDADDVVVGLEES